ncbi:MAG: hypothetical protein HXY18_14985 [Bryobacteraceae bacterium]|nr:hypothetical protein [Bryobacteraceae bacterium]
MSVGANTIAPPNHGDLNALPSSPVPNPRACYPWGSMSAHNGDKARFHRLRRRTIARRLRIRALFKAAPAADAGKSSAGKPGK